MFMWYSCLRNLNNKKGFLYSRRDEVFLSNRFLSNLQILEYLNIKQ